MWYTVYVNPLHLSIICSTESVSGFELFPFEINHLGHLSYHLIFNLTTRNGKNNKITSEKRVPFIELVTAQKYGPYHMLHIVWGIWYGAYYMAHKVWMKWELCIKKWRNFWKWNWQIQYFGSTSCNKSAMVPR